MGGVEVFAARLKWSLLSRSVSVCVGDPVSHTHTHTQKSPSGANGLPQASQSAMLAERLQPRRHDKTREVSRGRVVGWIPGVGVRVCVWGLHSGHPTPPLQLKENKQTSREASSPSATSF